MDHQKVVVVGGGVMGLTTALLIKEKLKGVQVEVISKSFSPDTTSDVAAGIFSWGLKGAASECWANSSWIWFQRLLKEAKPDKTGVSKLPAFFFSSHDPDQVENRTMKKLCTVYRSCTEKELNLAKPEGKFKYGVYLHTVQIDTALYLAYLTDRFLAAGGTIKQGTVKSFDELDGDVVVNASGVQARYLAGDKDVTAMRGQVLRVRAPWIKTALYADDVYVIPGQSFVCVGSIRQYGSWNKEADPLDSMAIWSRAVAVFPCLEQATILDAVAGLRPHRSSPRVEKEYMNGKTIVHNYGHCGYGIMSSPGSSMKAAELVMESLSSRLSKL